MIKPYKRIITFAMSATIALTSIAPTLTIGANVEETPDYQLQTILIDNNGTNLWTTKSWGGENILPNTDWNTSDISQYYENGVLTFEAKSNSSEPLSFRIGMSSNSHGENSTIYWTEIEKYKDSMIAATDWTAYSLPIKELVDAFPDSGFDIHNLWKIAISAVKSGNTVSFRNVKISSTDDERQYPFIKVNQVGYSCEGRKTARISYFAKFGSLNGKKWELVNTDTDEVVYSDTLSEATENDHLSGESVHIINFDEVTEKGTYYIRVPDANLDSSVRSPYDISAKLETDVLSSVKFRIGNDVYDELLTDMSKYYYHQRQGIDIEEKYVGKFARENLHPNDVAVKRWSDRDNPDAETYDISQGWYDAGDYGKYVSPGATSLENLLLAYDLYPDVFNNMTLDIPESDKSNDRYIDAPAILSEMKWEIDMFLKLEHESKDGSFYVAANYKDGVIYLEDTLTQSADHNSPETERDLRSHMATAEMCAMLAHAYIIYKEIPAYADYADQCLETSIRAWNWINDPNNEQHPSIGAANRTYTYKQEELDRSTFWAAGALYRAVTEAGMNGKEYEDYLLANCETENNLKCFTGASVGYNSHGRSFLGFFHYMYNNENINNKISTVFEKFIPWRKRVLSYENWGTDYPDWGYWWGSNQVINQSTMTLILGSILTEGKDAIPDEVILSNESAFNYMLGVNPISFSYVSGYGENSVKNIYSGIYSKAAKTDPYSCPDGYVTEGTNYYDNRHLSKYDGKCYMDSDAEWTTNENTIYGNAAMIFLTAAIMSRVESDADAFLVGDANCDGKVTIADSTAILQSIGNPDKYGLSELGTKNADCSNVGDGVTAADALAIQKYDAKVIEKLPEIT